MALETRVPCLAQGVREPARLQGFVVGVALWTTLWTAIVGGSILVGEVTRAFEPWACLARVWLGP